MTIPNAVELQEKGLHALEHGHSYLAMTCLEQAMAYGKTPLLCSYLAYCLALNKRSIEDAIALGREALEAEPAVPVFSLNLGKILLLADRREEAISVFRQGLASGRDPELIAALEALGVRNPPLFKALPRRHFLNRYAGLLRSWLGLR